MLQIYSRSMLFYTLFLMSFLQASSNTIISEIKKLEDRRDPKCYATASRLENFMYGTPLSNEARFSKNHLQKVWLEDLWKKASLLAEKKGLTKIGREEIVTEQEHLFSYKKMKNDNWKLNFKNGQSIEIEAKDKRQYSTVAYGLRALLAVRQSMFFSRNKPLLPLSSEVVEALKDASDFYGLAVLKSTDTLCRLENRYRVEKEDIEEYWKALSLESNITQEAKGIYEKENYQIQDLSILKSTITQKLSSYKAYNNINNQLFVRNLQVYFAKLRWPKENDEANKFRNTFTETMISFVTELYRGSQKLAMVRGHLQIEEKDVFDFVQTFIPHTINEFEDAIFFPKLTNDEQVMIESYDMDAFRDSGLHWTYLKHAIETKDFKAYVEPDPFAVELMVENVAQFAVLALRMMGDYGKSKGAKRLKTEYFTEALLLLQNKIEKQATLPTLTQKKEEKLSSVVNKDRQNFVDKYFTEKTALVGIHSMHRSSDWLNRLLRSYLKKVKQEG